MLSTAVGQWINFDHWDGYPAQRDRIIETIEPMEQEFGINVVTSVQAIVWEGLRKAGVTDPVPGYGRLLRDF